MASSERTNTIDSDGSNQCVEKTLNRGIENNNIDMNNGADRGDGIDNAIGDAGDQQIDDDVLRKARFDMVPHQQQHQCDGAGSGSASNNNSNINNIVNNRTIAEGANGTLDDGDQSHVDHLTATPDTQSTSTTTMSSSSSPSSSGPGVVRENGNHTRDGAKAENGLDEANNKHSSGTYYVMRK